MATVSPGLMSTVSPETEAACGRIGIARCTAAEQAAQHAHQVGGIATAVVALQSIEQSVGTALRLGVAPQCPHDHGQCGANRLLCGLGICTQLLGNLPAGTALQLRKQVVQNGLAHGMSCPYMNVKKGKAYAPARVVNKNVSAGLTVLNCRSGRCA